MAGFGGAIKLTGESEYRNALKNITQQLREVSSQMQLTNAKFDSSDKSIQALTQKQKELAKSYETQKKYVNELKSAYTSFASKVQDQANAHQKLENEYNKEKAELDKLEKTLGTTSTKYQEQKAKVESLSSELGKSRQAQEQNENALSKMGVALNKAETELTKTEVELKKLDTELKNAEKPTKEFADDIEEVGNNAKKTNEGFTVMKGAIANLVTNALQTAISAMKEFAKETIQVGMNFEAQMSKVKAISGATTEEMQKLNEKAKEMGATTKFTATESGQAFEYMAMAGWKTEDMLNGIEGIMALASASGADLATTSDIVTDALTGFGKSASEAGRLADIMAAASSNANTNVELMGETFKYVTPVAGSLGFSMEDTAIAIGEMANAGIKGSQAGTSLRSIMTRLATDAGASSKQLGALGILTEKLGVQFYNADGTVRDFNDIINESREAWKGLTSEEQSNYGKKIAGQEALSGWLAMMNASTDDVNKLTDAVKNSSGAAQEMSDTMMDNAQGGFTLLQSKLEGIQISMYEKFEPALEKCIDVLDKFLDALQFVVDHSAEFEAAIAGITAGFIAYLAVFKGAEIVATFVSVINKAKTAMIAFNAAVAANPIGVAVVAITALVTAFMVLWNKSEGFRNFWINLGNTIKDTVVNVVEGIKNTFSKIVDFFKNNWQNLLLLLVNPFAGAFKLLYNNCEGFKKFIDNFVENVKQFFVNIGTSIMSFFTETIPSAFNSVVEAIKNIFNNIVQFIQSIPAKIQELIQNIIDFISELPYKIGFVIGEILGHIIKFGQDLYNFATVTIPETIENIVNFFKELPEKIGQFLSEAWESIKQWGIDTWNSATETGQKFLTAIVDFFKEIPKKIGEFLTNAKNKIVEWATNVKDKAIETGTNFINNIVKFFKELPGKVGQFLSETFNKVKTFALDIAKKAKEGAQNLFDNIINTIKSLPQNMQNIGRNIVEGLWNGIKNAKDWIVGKVKDFARGILDGMKSALGIHSPSRVFRDQVGKFIALGVGEGFTDEMKSVTADMQDAIPTNFDTDATINGINANGIASNSNNYYNMVDAFKDALSQMKIEMNDEEMGKFVDKTVANSIYV